VSARPPFLIRPMRRTDSVQLAAIFASAWRHGHPYAPRVITETVFETETRGESVAVATIEGSPVGWTGLNGPERFIHHLYVDPAFHGRGIGRALLRHAVRLAGGRATLKCQTRNVEALAFYRAAGFTYVEDGVFAGEPWIRLASPPLWTQS